MTTARVLRRLAPLVLALALPSLAQMTPTAGKLNQPAQKPPEVPSSWKQVPIPKLPPFHPQEPKRIQLDNGMVIFLQEDHELPLIDGVMRIRGGARAVPADKTGMMAIYGQVWRTGGTTTKTGDQLDQFLESRAARVETGGGIDSTSISFSCLKTDLNDVFPVFVDLLMHPAFREDKIQLSKQQLATEISRRNDDIDDVVARESAKIAYGKDNPYARVPEYWTVSAVAQKDLMDWHASHVHPNNVILGIVGDFDSAQMEAMLRKTFGDWQKGPSVEAPKIEFHAPKPALYFAPKNDVDQSTVRMITLGIERRNPDYYAVEVMNEILGGGFSSRLFNEIRTKAGLAYSVGGGIGTAFDHPGMFRVGLGTKSASTVRAVEALKKALAGMDTQPVTEEELRRAKDAILNGFVFNFDSKEKVMVERMSYEFYGYPPDFLERYRAGIEKVTADDVDRVAKKYVHPDQMAVLVVGNAAQFGTPLSALGPVTTLDISIPEAPPGATPASGAPAASNPEGKALIGKIAEALGGEAKLQAVKSEEQKAEQTLKTPQGEITVSTDAVIVFPDSLHLSVQTPQGEQVFVVTPQAAFASMGPQSMELPADSKQEYLAGIHRDLIFLAQHASDPAFVFAAAGNEKIGDMNAAILEVSAAGTTERLYVDPQSGRVLRATYHVRGRSGPAEETSDYSDWRAIDGIMLPFVRELSQNGQPTRTVKIQSFQINPQVNPKLFAAPAGAAPAEAPR